jgi:hypothetical protein
MRPTTKHNPVSNLSARAAVPTRSAPAPGNATTDDKNTVRAPAVPGSPDSAPCPDTGDSTPPHRVESPEELARRVELLERRCAALEAGSPLAAIVPLLARIADAVAPAPAAIVGTPYVANKLGCTTVWVAEMVRKGDIPRDCVVPGTGTGKVWRFYRDKIDAWVAGR